ncbi:unnamed protein product [Parascedosporium putredinis]|uniref:Uncharacterized protein n=1 Tax=Parascedosporium putredinis TaxID=1442378 RepID=A0A9P1H173_9PEZI|nr:unnamed protein product [Parascedosporium putredinis]CAI7992477.1 unnamed protein product [Parascedosporium putredinis]
MTSTNSLSFTTYVEIEIDEDCDFDGDRISTITECVAPEALTVTDCAVTDVATITECVATEALTITECVATEALTVTDCAVTDVATITNCTATEVTTITECTATEGPTVTAGDQGWIVAQVGAHPEPAGVTEDQSSGSGEYAYFFRASEDGQRDRVTIMQSMSLCQGVTYQASLLVRFTEVTDAAISLLINDEPIAAQGWITDTAYQPARFRNDGVFVAPADSAILRITISFQELPADRIRQINIDNVVVKPYELEAQP